MKPADLVRMANQIAAFHAGYGEAEAVAGTAKHVRDFWDPRMRAALDRLVADGGTGLSPIALAAARTLSADAAA